MEAHAAEPRETDLLRLTAMITAGAVTAAEADKTSGAAIIIARRDRTVYLVTARHVVDGCNPPDCTIQVKFKRGQKLDTQPSVAQVIRIPAADKKYESPGDLYDIVGLKVDNLDPIPLIDFDVKRNPARPGGATDQLHAEGCIGSVPWSATETSRISASERLQFSTTHTYTGASGGAILNERGELLGMAQTADGALGSIAGIETEKIAELLKSVTAEPFPTDWQFVTPNLQVNGTPDARLTVTPGGSTSARLAYQVPKELSKLPMGALRLDLSEDGYVPTSINFVRRADVDQRVEYELVRQRFPWAVSCIITGGALILTGAVVGGVALHQHSEFDSNPSRETLDRVNRLNHAADGLFISGGAMIALGAGLHFLLPTSTAMVIEE